MKQEHTTPTEPSENRIDDFTDTMQIQKAIEKIADAETSDLAKLSEIPSLLEENLKEHLDDSPSADDDGTRIAAGTRPDNDIRSSAGIRPDNDVRSAAGIRPTAKSRSSAGLDDDPGPDAPPPADAPVSKWFFTFMCMNIPIVGWIYLLYLAFSKKVTNRRSFARAYLFYKLVFLLVGIVILAILIYIGMDLLDQLLAYMEML